MSQSHGRCQEIENSVLSSSLNPYLLLHKIVQIIITCIFLINDSAKCHQVQVNLFSYLLVTVVAAKRVEI